jgi:hypothetical protein
MNRTKARERVREIWLRPTERSLDCAAEIDDSLTEEYDWGWVFNFVPLSSDASPRPWPRGVAIDRGTGHTAPVGPKGVAEAVYRIASLNERYPQDG